MARRSAAENVQEYLPGTAPKKNQKVHNAAVRYFDRMQERKAAGIQEKDAKVNLTEMMIELGIDEYSYGGLEVHIDTKRNVKVKMDGKDEVDEVTAEE